MIRGIKRTMLIAMTLLVMFLMSVSVSAQFQASRTGVNYPISLKIGQTFSIKGSVTANTKIARAAVTIYDESGTKCLQRYSVNPSGKTFNIADADNSMTFNTLKAGEYYYRVSIFDASGAKISIANRQFKVVGATPTKETITKTGITVPESLKAGSVFHMKGTIKANFILKSITCTIYNSTGVKCLQRYEEKINGKSYDIKKADDKLHFEKLAAGSYYYRICVYNNAGKKFRITNKKFKVTAASRITISNPVPSNNVSLVYGSSLSLGGKITSTKNLAQVKGVILDSAGKTVYSKSVAPNAKTYTLGKSQIDTALAFEKLKEGTYTLKITAKDSAGKSATLINRVITVKKNGGGTLPPIPTTDDIQILYESPDKDVTIQAGSSYALGGIVAAKNKLNLVSVKLATVGGTVLVSKSLNPSAKVYILDNGVLDAAIEFEILPPGSYYLTITARDVLGNSRELSKHLIVIR